MTEEEEDLKNLVARTLAPISAAFGMDYELTLVVRSTKDEKNKLVMTTDSDMPAVIRLLTNLKAGAPEGPVM